MMAVDLHSAVVHGHVQLPSRLLVQHLSQRNPQRLHVSRVLAQHRGVFHAPVRDLRVHGQLARLRSTQVEGKRRRLRHVGCRLRHTLSSTAQPGKGAGEGQQQRGTTSRARLQNGRAAPRTGVRSVLNTRAASMPAQTQRQSESLTQRFGIRGAALALTPRQELYRHDACPPRPPSPAHPPCRLRLRIVLHSSLWPSQSARLRPRSQPTAEPGDRRRDPWDDVLRHHAGRGLVVRCRSARAPQGAASPSQLGSSGRRSSELEGL